MAKVNTAQAALVASALAPVPPSVAPAVGIPVVTDGCTLQPPPTVVKVGPVLTFNIADWKAAAERYKHGPQDATRYLSFKVGIPPEASQWVIKQYERLSMARLKKVLNIAAVKVSAGSGITDVKRVTGGIKIYGSTFLRVHQGFQAPWPEGEIPTDPRALLQIMNQGQGHVLVWKELIDGEPGAPIARTEPPFDDNGHEWVLRVGAQGTTMGVDVATGLPQKQLLVMIKLQRLPKSAFDQIQDAIGAVLDVFKAVLATVCKLITNDKLQQVANYGTMFPNPTVQASMLAWQGAAQACGYVLPQPSGPPACAVTAEVPALPAPDPWWKVHQKWLVLGGVVAGAVGIGAFLRLRAT